MCYYRCHEMIFYILVPCHTPGIIFLNLLKMRSKKKRRQSGWLRFWHRSTASVVVSAGFVCSPAGEQLHVFLRCCCKMPKPDTSKQAKKWRCKEVSEGIQVIQTS